MVDGYVETRLVVKKKKKVVTAEQVAALNCVSKWVFPDLPDRADLQSDDFDVHNASPLSVEPLLFEMHSHSVHSDGFLTPCALIERAHRNGVKVLALTDHDTMAGVPEVIEAARRYGIRIIPGVEISATFASRAGSDEEEPVHILAYYGSRGPANADELEVCLSSIREGRFVRAKEMLSKLNSLKMPIKWESLINISGHGVAPGRVHVARAMVEAGYVENLKQAFNRYLYDGGPAYARGKEPAAEEAVKLICRTGGVAILAHPWALKNHMDIIKSLKMSGLHGMEVYRADGKLEAFSDLADTYNLLKLGGSDFHGRGSHGESDMGSVKLPILSIHEFLKRSRPIWNVAMNDILKTFAQESSGSEFSQMIKFGRATNLSQEMD